MRREVNGYIMMDDDDVNTQNQTEEGRRREVNGYIMMPSDEFNSPNQTKTKSV